MNKTLTTEECLRLDIETYNQAIELQYKIQKNLSGDLSTCQHCDRKFVICCICDKAQKDWNDMIEEVKEVSEQNNNSGCYWKHYDVGMFGYHDYVYGTSCGKEYDSDKVKKENYCPNCGEKIK